MSKPEDSVLFRVHYFGSTSSSVMILFCPFGISAKQMALPLGPIWRMRRQGFQVIAYDYPLSIANKSPQQTINSLQAIMADVSARIAGLPPGTNLVCWGTSLGTALAARTTMLHPQVNKVVLNLSYGDIAEHIIHLPFMWLVPPAIKHRYIKAAGGKQGLHQSFDQYSPLHIAPHFKGKQVLLYLARHDRVQRWEHTEKLPQLFRQGGATVTYYENKYAGHYMGCLINHSRHKRYVPFLMTNR